MMPGRPKMMAKRVAELEERAMVLEGDVLDLTPSQYLKDDCGPDPLGLRQAWKNAGDAALDAYFALGDLGEILRKKAGIQDEDWEDEDWESDDEIDTPAPTDPARRCSVRRRVACAAGGHVFLTARA
jgi:hypothetical protein